MNLVIEIEAMRVNGIYDRFNATPDLCLWVSNLLGWHIDYRSYLKYKKRFLGRSGNDEDKEERFESAISFYAELKKTHPI